MSSCQSCNKYTPVLQPRGQATAWCTCKDKGYDARLYAETRAYDHLKTHVLVQSLGNGSASSVLQAIPSQVQGVQRHIV